MVNSAAFYGFPGDDRRIVLSSTRNRMVTPGIEIARTPWGHYDRPVSPTAGWHRFLNRWANAQEAMWEAMRVGVAPPPLAAKPPRFENRGYPLAGDLQTVGADEGRAAEAGGGTRNHPADRPDRWQTVRRWRRRGKRTRPRVAGERSQQLRGRLRVVPLDGRHRVRPRWLPRWRTRAPSKPRINCTSLMKNAINDSHSATPAATAVNRVSFALMVR